MEVFQFFWIGSCLKGANDFLFFGLYNGFIEKVVCGFLDGDFFLC